MLTGLIIFNIILAGFGFDFGRERAIGGFWSVIMCLFLGIVGFAIIFAYPKKPENQEINKADELKKWYDLKESGAITEQDYLNKKNEIINR